MAEKKPRKSQSPNSDLRRALPMLAALFALLALWLGWGGVQQWRDARLGEELRQSRDTVLSSAEKTLTAQLKQLADRVAAAPTQNALRAGDKVAAAQAIGNGWKGASPAQILPDGLEAAYAAPADFGFSKLALLEAALSENKPVARVVREGKQSQLGLATPAGDGVAYVYVPLKLLTASLDQGAVPSQAYVALRQGGYTIHEAGNRTLSEGAESLARPIGTTGMRVVPATPDGPEAPLGLGAISSLVVAVITGLLAILTLLLARGRLKLNLGSQRSGGATEENEPTLGQTLQREPLPSAPTREPSNKDSPAVSASSEPKDIDAGIFRAYDIRGVVGDTLSVAVAQHIGQAIGTVLEEQGLTDIVVGRDGRLSGPELSAGLIEGLRKAGRNVIDIGLAPTPV
ncbi:MAG: phosphomannomutase/phosphoglucomutase, partial [Pseudoxanthomonas sp.]